MREPGLFDLPPADGFYPNRRDQQKHDGALKRVPTNTQSVQRFTDAQNANASPTVTSNPLAGYKKSRPGEILQPGIPVQPCS